MGLQSVLKIRAKTSKLFALLVQALPCKGSKPRAHLEPFIFSIVPMYRHADAACVHACVRGDRKLNPDGFPFPSCMSFSYYCKLDRARAGFRKFSKTNSCIARARRGLAGLTVYPPRIQIRDVAPFRSRRDHRKSKFGLRHRIKLTVHLDFR
jgi:hypothetical protein